VREKFCFRAVCMYLIIYQQCVNVIPYKLLAGISPNLQPQCSWPQRWTDWVLRSKCQRSKSRWDHMWSSNHFGRHVLTYLICGMYGCIVIKTYHNYSLPAPYDIDDIFKVTGFKDQGHRQYFPKTYFPADACRSVVWMLMCKAIFISWGRCILHSQFFMESSLSLLITYMMLTGITWWLRLHGSKSLCSIDLRRGRIGKPEHREVDQSAGPDRYGAYSYSCQESGQCDEWMPFSC